MKLVEILARTWSKWQVGRNYKVSQSEFGVLYVSFENSPNGTTINLGWQCDIATDWKSAVVTRTQWEAERARIAAMEGISSFSQEQANAEAERDQQSQYEQELWDRVASFCYTRHLDDCARAVAAQHSFKDADAFMAERAKRLKERK